MRLHIKRFYYVQIQQLFLVILIMLNTVTNTVFAEISKSPIDEKLYRALQLDNGLKVVVVSDPNADKAAVSMDVAAGSGTDPKQWPGMAHFLEHMLNIRPLFSKMAAAQMRLRPMIIPITSMILILNFCKPLWIGLPSFLSVPYLLKI